MSTETETRSEYRAVRSNGGLGVLWPKKHKYSGGYPEGRCKYCGRQTGLDMWQLKTMPKEMAICTKGEHATIWEILTGKYDTSPNITGEALPISKG